MVDLGIVNLDIYITGKCNYKCRYCYGENDCLTGIKIETYEKCLEFAKYINAKNIELCGGEPLVEKNFELFVSMAQDSGFDVILRTNGILVPQKIDFIAENCSWVGISLDGLPEENALMRESKTPISKEEQFFIPLKAIRDLKIKNSNIKILLASVLSSKNCDAFLNFISYIKEENLPIDRWKIYQFVTDKFRSLENDKEFFLEDEKFESIAKMIPDKINDTQIIVQPSKGLDKATNCLIVRQNGDIILSNVFYGNVVDTPFDLIVENLIKGNVLNLIKGNKNLTYNN